MDNQPPYSTEAEEAVIGSVLISPIAYLNVASFLKADDFFFLRHSYIWQAIGKLELRGDDVDSVTVSQELQAMGVLAEVGGPAFLTQLIRSVPTSVHAEVYGHLVERAALRRKLMVAADKIKLMAEDQSREVGSVFAKSESLLLDVTGYGIEETPTDMNTIMNDYLTSVERLRESGEKPGIPTGFIDVDKIIGGSYKSEVMLIAGPAKSGKSTYNLNVIRKRAKMGARIALFITEMNREAVTRKFISMETGIPIETLKSVTFTPTQYSLFIEASIKVSKWKIHIVDEYRSLTPIELSRKLRKIMQKDHIDYLSLDGLWMMSSDTKKDDKKYVQIEDIMAKIVGLSASLNIPIDVMHQCNLNAKERNDKRFILSDLEGGSAAAKYAYTIVGLYRESYYIPGGTDDLEVIVRANRDGNIGTAILPFDKRSESYSDLTPYKKVVQPTMPNMEMDQERRDIYQ